MRKHHQVAIELPKEARPRVAVNSVRICLTPKTLLDADHHLRALSTIATSTASTAYSFTQRVKMRTSAAARANGISGTVATPNSGRRLLPARVGVPYSQAPAGRLPVEALRKIFNIDAYESRPDKNHPRVRTCWMRLDQVCRAWRSLLMGTTTLWAADVLAFGFKSKGFQEILARAQGAALSLYIATMSSDDLTTAFSLMSRAKDIQYHGSQRDLVQPILDFVSSRSLPSLEMFIMDSSLCSEKFEQQNTTSLAKHTNLRCLGMHGLYIVPPVNGNLVWLTIHSPPQLWRPSMDTLLQILSKNARLEGILLHDAFHTRTGSLSNSAASVELPALVKCCVTFVDTVRVSHAFLGLLRMPNVRTIELKTNWMAHSSASAEQKTAPLAAILSACSGAPAFAHDMVLIRNLNDQTNFDVGFLNGAMIKLSFSLKLLSSTKQAAHIDAVVGHLSRSHIFESTRIIRIIALEVRAPVTRSWAAMFPFCTRTERIWLTVPNSHAEGILKDLAAARADLELMPNLHLVSVDVFGCLLKEAPVNRMLKSGPGLRARLEITEDNGLCKTTWHNE